MKDFFDQPGVCLIETRDRDDGERRYTFTIDEGQSAEQMAALLQTLPAGASIEFFDIEYPQLSDPGAFVTLTRHADGWSLKWRNHGWSSARMAVLSTLASAYLAACYADDWGSFLRNKSSRRLTARWSATEIPSHSPDDELTPDQASYLSRRLGNLPDGEAASTDEGSNSSGPD